MLVGLRELVKAFEVIFSGEILSFLFVSGAQKILRIFCTPALVWLSRLKPTKVVYVPRPTNPLRTPWYLAIDKNIKTR